MTTEFKVGDRVRRINKCWNDIELGEEFVVSHVTPRGSLSLVGRPGRSYMRENFELVEPAFVPKFRKGDRVIGVERGSGVEKGREYTVIADSYVHNNSVEVVNVEDVWGYVYASRFEKIQEEAVTETFDTYDERMLPLFAKASAEAEHRGYCAEYDRIAAVVGAPSREEIKRLTAPAKTPKELAQEAFDAIPVGHTFHFLDNRSKRHVKLSATTFIYDRGENYSGPREIETWLRFGIEAN